MHYVYILKSLKVPLKTYIGLTKDLDKRLKEHNSGRDPYTQNGLPWKIETFIGFSDKETAQNFERYLKAGSGQAFMKKRLLPKL